MEILSWTGLALALVGVACALVGAFKGRPRALQAGALLLVLGMVAEAVFDVRQGRYGWLAVDLVLVAWNAAVFVRYCRKATA